VAQQREQILVIEGLWRVDESNIAFTTDRSRYGDPDALRQGHGEFVLESGSVEIEKQFRRNPSQKSQGRHSIMISSSHLLRFANNKTILH